MIITYTTDEDSILFPGHSVGQQYQFESNLSAYDFDISRSQRYSETLSGKIQKVDYGRRATINFTTIYLNGNDALLAEEAFSTIINGKIFLFDPTGTIANPSGVEYSCQVARNKYRKSRLGLTEYFNFQIQASVQSGL